VFVAAVDVVLAADTVLQHDVLVARRADLTDDNLPAAPVLAVGVLSTSTERVDLGTKKLTFEAAGVASYWVVDPDEPSLTVFELEGGVYGVVARVSGAAPWHGSRPFPVTVVPAALVE